MQKKLILIIFICVAISGSHIFSQDVNVLETNINSLSNARKNNKAIDEYKKLFSLTKKHDVDLLHKITIGSLKDENPFMRAGGAIAAGQLGNDEAEPLLRANLNDRDIWVRVWTAISISEVGDKKTVPDLVNLLNDRIDFVRISAVVSLGRLGDSSNIPDIAKALKDRNANVRQMAAIALGRIGNDSAIPYLEKLLMEDNDMWARLAAVASLEKLLRKRGK